MAYCQEKMDESLDQVADMCADLHPKKKKTAYKQCAADVNDAWSKPQDKALAQALNSQSKRFVIDFTDLLGIKQTTYSLEQCGKFIVNAIQKFGAPDSYSPFEELTLSNLGKFLKLKEKVVVVVGNVNDPVFIEYQKHVVDECGSDAKYFFIDKNSKLLAEKPKVPKKYKKVWKKWKQKNVYNYYSPTEPAPQRFDYQFDGKSWSWQMAFLEDAGIEEKIVAESVAKDAAIKTQTQAKAKADAQAMMVHLKAKADAKEMLAHLKAKADAEAMMSHLKAKADAEKLKAQQTGQEEPSEEPAELPFIELKKKDFNTYFGQDKMSGLVLVLDMEKFEHCTIYNDIQGEGMFGEVGFTVLLDPKKNEAFNKLRILLAKKAPGLKTKDIKAPGVYKFENGELFACHETATVKGWVCKAPDEVIGPEPTPTPPLPVEPPPVTPEPASQVDYVIVKPKEFDQYIEDCKVVEMPVFVMILDMKSSEDKSTLNKFAGKHKHDGMILVIDASKKFVSRKLKKKLAKLSKDKKIKHKQISTGDIYKYDYGCLTQLVPGTMTIKCAEPTPAVEEPETPGDIEKIPPLKIPEAFAEVPPEIPEVEKSATPPKPVTPDPEPGVAVTLMPANFNQFFHKISSRNVIVAIMDPGPNKYGSIVEELEKEQQALAESDQAYIAVLDVTDKETVEALWQKLTNKYVIPQKPKGLIDHSFLKPFAVLQYGYDSSAGRNVLKSYDGSVAIVGKGPLPPPVPELKPEVDKMQNTGFNFLSWVKKGSHIVKFPVTVYLVHDPSDYNFVASASKAKKNANKYGGSVFYINWSKPENQALATILNLPPLTDAMKFTAWQIEKDQIGKFGYVEGSYTGVTGEKMALDYLLDASYLWGDDRFHYVLPENFDDYFSAENREDSIVVVGDLFDSKTQKLLEKISEEKKDLGHDKRLIMIPFAKDYGIDIDKANFKEFQGYIKADLAKLGIKLKSPPGKPLVYEITYKDGKKKKTTYTPHGFMVWHPDNQLWKKEVINSGQNVLVVVGATGKVWDASGGVDGKGAWNKKVPQATKDLKTHLAEDMSDGTVKVGKKKVKKLVYISHADFERIWASDIEKIKEMESGDPYAFADDESIPALYFKSKTLPMMFLISGSAGNRNFDVVDGDQVGMPDTWTPVKKPKETVIKKPLGPAFSASVLGLKDVVTVKVKLTEGAINDKFEDIKKNAEKNKSSMLIAWNMFAKTATNVGMDSYIVVVGKRTSKAVKSSKKKLVESGEDQKLVFIDTKIDEMGGSLKYKDKKQELDGILNSLFGFTSADANKKHKVMECNKNGKGQYSCSPYQF